MTAAKEKVPLDQLRKQITTEIDRQALLNKTQRLPSVHFRSVSHHSAKYEVLSRDISHRLDLAQKSKSSFENLEVHLREILGIKENKSKLPTDLESLSSFLQKSSQEVDEKLIQDLEKMKVNVLNHKEKFLGTVVKEGGLLFRTQSGLLQPQMCKLYESVVKKVKGGKDEVNRAEVELGVPSGRKEAEILIAWLEGMSEMYLEDEELGLDEKVKRAQMIYTACFKEVVRQVSVNCIERGVLIQRIWNASVDLTGLREDLRLKQMQELKDKVQNVIDTAMAELKTRCEKAESLLAELKKGIKEKDLESVVEGLKTEEKSVSVMMDIGSFRKKQKNTTLPKKKKSLKSIVEESESKLNEIPVIPKQPIVLFGYLDDENVFHKQRIVHKSFEGLRVNDYFDEVLKMALGTDAETVTETVTEKKEVVEEKKVETKGKIVEYFVRVSQQATQFPERKPIFQVAKQFGTRILIKGIKKSEEEVKELRDKMKSVKDEQASGDEDNEESEDDLEVQEKEFKGKEESKAGKGKFRMELKRNLKPGKQIRRKNEPKIKILANLIGEELKNENRIASVDLNSSRNKVDDRPKSKSQIHEEPAVQDPRTINRKVSKQSEKFSVLNTEKLFKIPAKERSQEFPKNQEKQKLNEIKEYLTDRKTERKLNSEYEEETKTLAVKRNQRVYTESIEKAENQCLEKKVYSESLEKKVNNQGLEKGIFNEKFEERVGNEGFEKKVYYDGQKKEKFGYADTQKGEIKSSKRPEEIYTFSQEITEKMMQDKPQKPSNVLYKELEKAENTERSLAKSESVPVVQDPIKGSGKKGKFKTSQGSKRSSPLKSSAKLTKPLQPQQKPPRKSDPDRQKPQQPDRGLPITPSLTFDKSCQVQLDSIPSEDLTRSQMLSSIQQIKKTLETFLSDSKKRENLFKDARSIKRVKKLSNVLKSLFAIAEQHPNTHFEYPQSDFFESPQKNIAKNELTRQISFERSENENSPSKTRQQERLEKGKSPSKHKTQIEEFTLGVVSRKVIITHPGQKMLSLVMQSLDSYTAIRATMSIKSLIKIINSVHTEKINMLKENSNKKFEVTMVLYDILINMYGLKTVAENKFKQVIISSLAYREQYPRVWNFSEFLGFNCSYVAEDWNFYLNIFDNLDYNNLGVNIGNDPNHYSAVQSLSFCVRQYFDKKVSEADIDEILAVAFGLVSEEVELEGKRRYVRSDLVNTDRFLDVLMKFYYRVKGKVYEKLGVSVGREDFVNWEQFVEIVLRVCKKELDVLERVFEGHCVIKKDEEGGLNKLIRMESVLSVIIDLGLTVE